MTSDTASIPTESKEAVAAAPNAPSIPSTPATEQTKGAVEAPAADKQQDKAPSDAKDSKTEPTTAEKLLSRLKDGPKNETSAPEKYEDFKLPEGVKLAEGITSTFTDLARKANLSQKDAQASLDKLVEAQREQVQQDLKAQVDAWGEELAKDPEFGGDKLETETYPAVEQFLTAYDPSGSLRELLLSGLGTHPALVRVLATAGRAVKETSELVTGPRSAPKDAGFTGLYVNTKF